MRSLRSDAFFLLSFFLSCSLFATEAHEAVASGGGKVETDEAIKHQRELLFKTVSTLGECSEKYKYNNKHNQTPFWHLKDDLLSSMCEFSRVDPSVTPPTVMSLAAMRELLAKRFSGKSYGESSGQLKKIVDQLADLYHRNFSKLKEKMMEKPSEWDEQACSNAVVTGGPRPVDPRKARLRFFKPEAPGIGVWNDSEESPKFEIIAADTETWLRACNQENLADEKSFNEAASTEAKKDEARKLADTEFDAAIKGSSLETRKDTEGVKLRETLKQGHEEFKAAYEAETDQGKKEKLKSDYLSQLKALSAEKEKGGHLDSKKAIDALIAKIPTEASTTLASSTTTLGPAQSKLKIAADGLLEPSLTQIEIDDRRSLVERKGWQGLSDQEVDGKIAQIQANDKAKADALVSYKNPDEIKASDAEQLKKEELLITNKIKELDGKYREADKKARAENNTELDVKARDALKLELATYRELQTNNKALQQRSLAEAQPEFFSNQKPTLDTYTAERKLEEAKKGYEELKSKHISAPAYNSFIKALEANNPYAPANPGQDQNLIKIKAAFDEMKRQEAFKNTENQLGESLRLAKAAELVRASKSGALYTSLYGSKKEKGYLTALDNDSEDEDTTPAKLVQNHEYVFEEAMKLGNPKKQQEFLAKYFQAIKPTWKIGDAVPENERGNVVWPAIVKQADEFVSEFEETGGYNASDFSDATNAEITRLDYLLRNKNISYADKQDARSRLKQIYILNKSLK